MERESDSNGEKRTEQIARALRQSLGAESSTSLEVISHKDLIEKYELFKKSVEFDTGVIYHPCGANDVSPSEAFPGSRVIYADIDDKAMQVLRNAGYEALTQDVRTFNPGPVDVAILLNPSIEPDTPVSFVKDGGYAICNDYHQTASSLKETGAYELSALIHNTKEHGLSYDTQDLEDCWKEIETDEEFKNASPGFGTAYYEATARLVETVTGQRENVTQEYKKIIEMIRNNTLEGVSRVVDQGDAIVAQYKGNLIALPSLPKKKGGAEDIFVFRKKMPEVSV
jgi:hypothetical protein